MALSLSFLHDANGNIGQLRTQMVDVTFDDDYPTGGYSISGSDSGIGTFIYGAEEVGSNTIGLLYDVSYNPFTKKLEVSGLSTRTTSYTTALDGATNLAGTEGNADQAAGPVNGDLLFSDDIGNLVDDTITPVDSPDVTRNIVITLENGTIGALLLFVGVTTFTITGTDENDAVQTEAVTLTSTNGNKSVAASKFRFVQGIKPFKTVDNIVITNPPADDFTVEIGPGTRIRIPDTLQTPAVGDVISASADAVDLTISAVLANAGGVDVTNNSINSGTVADADILIVEYNPTSETEDGTNLSAVVKRIQFLGV